MAFPIISKVMETITNIVIGQVIERTRTKQGKARPWLLVSAPLMAITGVLLFAVPQAKTTVRLQLALIELMKENEFDMISISDLVKRAGVSRTGYYRNYNCKEDILKELLEQITDKVVSAILTKGNNLEQCVALFEMTKENAESFTLLQKAHFGDVMLYEITQKVLNLLAPDNDAELMLQTAICGATYNIIRTWIENGMDRSTIDLATEYCHIFVDPLFPENA